ncbi:MAG: polysaccharide deacetylase family protein, partial [Eubacteriales bacterium]
MKILILKKNRVLMIALFILFLAIGIIYAEPKIESVQSQKLKPIYSVKTTTNQIAITFDISWGEENLVPVLDALKKENIKATFFLSSPWAEKHSELVKMIVTEGHEIGSHGKRHVDLNTLSQATLLSELTEAQKSLETLSNQKIALLRPPNGAYDNQLITTAKNIDQRVIQWSIDSLDWQKP